MSLEATNWVWEHSKASGNDLIVLLRIADNANADGGGAYPGIVYLAKAARASRRTVFDCLRRLKASGELVEEQHGGGRLSSDGTPGRKTIYRVVIDGSGNGAESASYSAGETVQPDVGTVQPDVGNGADPRSAYIRNRTTQEPPKEPPPAPQAPKAKKSRKVQDHPEAQRLCDLLADLIAKNADGDRPYSSGKPAPQKWLDAVRLMLTSDKDGGGYSLEQVEYLIRWSQEDSFEAKVVCSMPKLRERRRVLIQKIKPNGHNGNGRYVNDDRWKPATTPRRRYGEDYTPEQKAELDRLLEDEWAGRQVLGRNLPAANGEPHEHQQQS